MYCHHILSKTDTGYTQSKISVHILNRTDTARVCTRRIWRRSWTMYTFHADTGIIFLHVTNTRMMSRGERKVDRLKREFHGAAKEAATCVVPMHAPQTSSLWRGVGEVGSACEVGCRRRVQVTTKAVMRRG